MSESAQLWLASGAFAVISALAGIIWRSTLASNTRVENSNLASNTRVEKQVGEIGKNVDKLTMVVFGVNNDNGLYGDMRTIRAGMSRMDGFVQGVSLHIGVECDEKGTVRILTDESPMERRYAERRESERREAERRTGQRRHEA